MLIGWLRSTHERPGGHEVEAREKRFERRFLGARDPAFTLVLGRPQDERQARHPANGIARRTQHVRIAYAPRCGGRRAGVELFRRHGATYFLIRRAATELELAQPI